MGMTKAKLKQLRVILLTIIAGGLCGTCLLFSFQFYNAELKQNELDRLNVLTPSNIRSVNVRDLNSTKLNGVKVYYQKEATIELEVLEYLLTRKEVSEYFNLPDEGDNYQIYLLATVDNGRLLRGVPAKTEHLRTETWIASGNYLYLSENYSKQIPKPISAYQSLWAGLSYVKLYNSLSGEQKGKAAAAGEGYNLGELALVKDYAALTNNKAQAWSNPYPSKLKEYESQTDLCLGVGSFEHLLLCEAALYQANSSSSLPPKSLKFLADNFKLEQQAAYRATNSYTAAYLATQVEGLGLEPATLKFTAWDFPLFDSTAYTPVGEPLYLQRVDQAKLDSLKAKLKGEGWQEQTASNKQADDQFKAATHKLTFSKANPLLQSQLTIAVMDTSSLAVDCILEGVGVIYCDQASISKNSGLYLQLTLGQYAKYELESN